MHDAPVPPGRWADGLTATLVVVAHAVKTTEPMTAEERRPRAAASVTAMDISIHSGFLPHDARMGPWPYPPLVFEPETTPTTSTRTDD
jgi:hypothetical protein